MSYRHSHDQQGLKKGRHGLFKPSAVGLHPDIVSDAFMAVLEGKVSGAEEWHEYSRGVRFSPPGAKKGQKNTRGIRKARLRGKLEEVGMGQMDEYHIQDGAVTFIIFARGLKEALRRVKRWKGRKNPLEHTV